MRKSNWYLPSICRCQVIRESVFWYYIRARAILSLKCARFLSHRIGTTLLTKRSLRNIYKPSFLKEGSHEVKWEDMLAEQKTISLVDRVKHIQFPFPSKPFYIYVLFRPSPPAPPRHAASTGYPAATHNLDELHQRPISVDHLRNKSNVWM